MSVSNWICDKCGEIIKTASEGYVLWDSNEQLKSYGFIIVHQKKCDDRTKTNSMPLEDFLGNRGLTYLTSMLSIGPIKKNIGQGNSCSIKDMDEFVDFFRRVQIPYYEQARIHFSTAEFLNEHHDDNEVGPYLSSQLKKITEDYE
jgi:hypothetical protein